MFINFTLSLSFVVISKELQYVLKEVECSSIKNKYVFIDFEQSYLVCEVSEGLE